MKRIFEIDNLNCHSYSTGGSGKIAYILYPMNILDAWIEPAAKKYGTDIVVINDMDWDNVFSPWPAKGVPRGCPDFEGKAPAFLALLQNSVIPKIEKELGYTDTPERTLVGVSMSGLFALWQWMVCDTFANIASLSGSFWYDGFLAWMQSRDIPQKTGRAYFLLGENETKSSVKAFDLVGPNTLAIFALLTAHHISTTFRSVPGGHYADTLPRLNQAFTALYLPTPATQ